MNSLERRIIDISYKKGLSHLSSCLTAVNLIDEIYSKKGTDEPFVLSNGHAGLALYVVLEKHGFGDAAELFGRHGVHPNRDLKDGIYCSSGSLGHGIGIALGMALADRTRPVHVLTSDGECAEGSVWETLRIAGRMDVRNLLVTVNANGYGAYSEINPMQLQERIDAFYPCNFKKTDMKKWPEYLQGLSGHYHILTKEEYETLIQTSPA